MDAINAELRVLLVEDDDTSRELLTELLEGEGYLVIASATVREAQAHLRACRFDLTVADLRLPDGSALDLSQQGPFAPALLVITGSDASARPDFDAPVVQKPFDVRVLLDHIARGAMAGRRRLLASWRDRRCGGAAVAQATSTSERSAATSRSR